MVNHHPSAALELDCRPNWVERHKLVRRWAIPGRRGPSHCTPNRDQAAPRPRRGEVDPSGASRSPCQFVIRLRKIGKCPAKSGSTGFSLATVRRAHRALRCRRRGPHAAELNSRHHLLLFGTMCVSCLYEVGSSLRQRELQARAHAKSIGCSTGESGGRRWKSILNSRLRGSEPIDIVAVAPIEAA